MKNSQKGFVVPLLIAIIAVLVIGGGVYVYENNKTKAPVVDTATQQQDQSQQQINSQSPTPATQSNQAFSWKTYSNPEHQFSIQYPSNWVVDTGVGGTLVRFRPANQVQKPDTDTPIDQVFVRQEQGCSSADWNIGFADANYKHVCMISLNLGIDAVALSSNSKSIEESILKSFSGMPIPSNQGSVPEVSKKYTDNDFGFTFTYPTAWQLATKVIGSYGNTLVLTQPNGDSISVAKVSDVQVLNQDAKFGNVLYYFNVANNTWMTIGDSERGDDATYAVPATPSFYTNSGSPVFGGRGRWKTDIIALSYNNFLVVNVTGSGDSSTLDPFVKTIVSTRTGSIATLPNPALIPNPTVSSVLSSSGVSSQFNAGEQVTINGSNFPTSGKLTVWIGSQKVTNMTSVTSQRITFIAPSVGALYPGNYKLFVTGIVNDPSPDPSSLGFMVQSNLVPVTVLPSLVINSLSASSVRVGDTLSISGKGFKLDKSGVVEVEVRNPVIQGRTSSGILWEGQAQNDNTITFTVPSWYCSFGGAPGVPCTEQPQLVPGNYTVQIFLPNGGDSNTVNLTVR